MSELLVFVGTYTETGPGASKGIYAARFDTSTGKLTAPNPVKGRP